MVDKSSSNYPILSNVFYNRMRYISRDAGEKIKLINDILSNNSASTFKHSGGDPNNIKIQAIKENIESTKQNIKERISKIPDLNTLTEFRKVLENFKTSLDSVIGNLDKAYRSKSDMKSYPQDSYEEFINNLAGKSGLRKISTIEGNTVFLRKDEDTDIPNMNYTSLLEIFRPLISDYNKIREKIEEYENEKQKQRGEKGDADSVRTFELIEQQLDHNKTLVENFISLLNNVEKQIEKYGQTSIRNNNTFNRYSYDGFDEKTNSIFYKSDNVDTNRYVIKLESKENISDEDYLVDINMSEGDSLAMIQSDSIIAINNYVEALKDLYKSKPESRGMGRRIKDIANDISKIKSIERGKEEKGQLIKKYQKGGVDPEKTNMNREIVYDKMFNFVSSMNSINSILTRIKDKIRVLEEEQKDMEYYMTYIAQIGMMKDVQQITLYRYIDFAMIKEYSDKVKNILSKINMSTEYSEYFRKYHKITLARINMFLDFLLLSTSKGEPANPNKYVINIRECTGPIFYDFVIFNHFKNILDKI